MMAWLKRPLVLVAIGLFALGGLLGGAAYAFRDNLARYSLKPSREFDAATVPTKPDYTQASAWVKLPTAIVKPVDVFFVYPAVFYGAGQWNAPTDDAEAMERVGDLIVPLYAGPFVEAANVFIPRYRQAGPYAFMTSQPSAQDARRLAYDDVAAAFQNFISSRNQARPFAIVGHGQGALYAIRLLHDQIAKDESLRGHFIAAYFAEVAMPADLFQDYLKPLELCGDGLQLGCVNVWHSTKQGARNDLPRTTAPVWKPDGSFDSTRGRSLACVNPLTWTVDGRAADVTMNLGAATVDSGSAKGVSLAAGETSADCWNGMLYVDDQPAPLFGFAGPRYRDLFPPTTNLFYENIRQNFAQRVEAFRQSSAAPPVDGTDEVPAPGGQPAPMGEP